VIEIVFTCWRHKQIALQAHTPRNFPVIWLVDRREIAHFRDLPEGITVIATDFPRCGNLKGPSFIKGYIQLLKSLPSGLVLKRDSDTIIENPLELIPSQGKAGKGVSYSTGDVRILGCAYCLDTTYALPLMEEFATKGWFSGDDIWISKALTRHLEILPTTRGVFVGDDQSPDAVFINLVNHRQFPIRNQNQDSSSSA
jgi:hypothetical protein